MGRSRYDEALADFRASREIVASPNTRLEMARCLKAEGRLAGAYTELGRTEVEAKELASQDSRYQRAYDAARAERAELEPHVGFVSLTIENASESTRVLVGGEELPRAAWSQPAPAEGTTELLVETPGLEPIKRTISVSPGQKTSVAIDAKSDEISKSWSDARPSEATSAPSVRPERQPPSWVRAGAYVAGGLGVAGIATFAIFGLVARSKYDELDAACGGGPCPPDKASEISSGKTNQTIANAGLGVGLVGAATGATMFLLSIPVGTHGQSSRWSHGTLAISPGWVGLRGDF